MRRKAIQSWGSITLVLCLATHVQAAVYVPPGLNPGDKYQLAFVTRDGRDALSADIMDYNNFVAAQAALNPSLTGTAIGVSWFAIASTQAVDARDNAVIGANVPIYLLDGTKIASGYAGVWGDQSLDAPLNVTQFGVQTLEIMAWTGSEPSGQEYVIVPSGSVALGTSLGAAGLGNPQVSIFTWNWSGTDFKERSHPLYALSEELTAVPEPGTSSIGFGALVSLFARCRSGDAHENLEEASPRPITSSHLLNNGTPSNGA